MIEDKEKRKMFKEEYEKLELKVIEFDSEDVITASPGGDDNTPGGGWG